MVLLREVQTQTDTDLLEACRNGDPSAYDVLVCRYKDRMFNVVLRYLGHYEDALDICQEACVRAYFALDSFRGEARFSTWIFGIALNLARNRRRDASRKGRNKGVSLEAMRETAPGRAQDLTATAVTPRSDAIANETQEALQTCLNELDETLRITFILRIVDDMSYREIAEVTGVPVGTVKSRLNTARRTLHERLKAQAVI